jgi:uncharacterized protein YbbC (DUF1343 family)
LSASSPTKLGVEVLLDDPARLRRLRGRRLALLGHPASVTGDGRHSMDAVQGADGLNLTAAFGPQHGMRGDKQDNMIETEDYLDHRLGIPVFSLYGAVRYPTEAMLESFDTLLVDLQDIGTRIYTYVTTLAYVLDAAAKADKAVWILDRPNPAGRPVEGTILEPGWESFVGAAPLIMRHGLTFGELARWLTDAQGLDLELEVVPMRGYRPEEGPGFGWPLHQLSWVNPSPNASCLNMARCFPGTVLLEGTTLSEGRGTTTPLEVVGAPDLDFRRVLARMAGLCPAWLEGCLLRGCHFEPTFHKHAGRLCSGLQIHTDNRLFDQSRFRPYRIAALLLKAVRELYPDYLIWRDFPYEYETERMAIDLLSGGTFLREWVDDPGARPADLEARLVADERAWRDSRAPYLTYGKTT